ncbi:MAG: hypothetical protein IKS84_06880 [Lachnospiraceae bacterium]|nr:hypothetical protein [Lachnospiraceae bacterium]
MKNPAGKKSKNIYLWLILFALINLTLVCFLYHTDNLALDENDEYGLSNYQAGVYGEYLPDNALDENIVFSTLMSTLFKVFPVCNWLILTCVLLYFFSYNSFMYYFLKRTGNGMLSFILTLIILIMSYRHTYDAINNCSVAGMAAIAGILLLMCALENDNAYFEWIAGTVILCLGAGIRFSGALMGMGFGLIFAVCYLKDKKITKKVMVKVIVPVIILMALFVTDRVYFSTPKWKEALELTALREYVNDRSSIRFGAVRYDDGTEMGRAYWDGLGIDREDCKFLTSWYCGDRNVFNKEMLTRLVEYDKQYQYTGRKFVRWAVKAVLTYVYIIFDGGRMELLLLAAVALAVNVCTFVINKKRRLESVLIYLITDLEIAYCMVLDRLLARVIIIPLLCSIIISLYFITEVDKVREFDIQGFVLSKGLFGRITFTAAACILIAGVIFLNPVRTPEYRDWDEFIKFKNSIDTTGSKELYIFSSGSITGLPGRLFDCPRFGAMTDCIPDTGWGAMLVYTHDRLEEFGYGNSPYECMLGSDHIYFVGHSDSRMRLDFIRRHYDEDIDVSRVYSYGGYNAYSITAKPDKTAGDKDIAEWDIEAPVLNNDDEAFWNIEGHIKDHDSAMAYFLELKGDDKCYCYEVRVEDDKFLLGVPAYTWEKADECSVRLFMNTADGAVFDDDMEYVKF